MRTIKFRAWDMTQKVMIYPESDLIKTHHEGSFPPDGMEVEITLEGYAHINQQYAYESTSYLDNELTLLQFTGLKDNNGVEIYEGDVVRINALKFEVTKNDFTQEWVIDGETGQERLGLAYKKVKVIGNIYENLELYKEASE